MKKKIGLSDSSRVVTFPSYNTSENVETAREKNIVGLRIADARKKHGLTLDALRELLCNYGVEIQVAGLNKWEKGITVPNAYQFIAVCQALDIEDNWFGANAAILQLNSEGLRKLDDYKNDLIASGRYKPVPAKYREGSIDMPVSTLAVSAGTGEFLDEDGFAMIQFPKSAVPNGADFGVRVNGDSMEPVYHDDQIVWVEKTDTLQPGEVGVLICNGEGYLKVYDLHNPAPEDVEEYMDSYGVLHPQVRLVSYNKRYNPKEIIPGDTFSIVGRVLSLVTT